MIQSGQFDEVHDGGKYDVIELTKYPAFALRLPGRSHPHFATLVQNKLLPLLFILQEHSVICEKGRKGKDKRKYRIKTKT
jgi:hypothetical protein